MSIYLNLAFQIKRAYKNFKVLVLNSEVENSHQHNIIIFTCLFVQETNCQENTYHFVMAVYRGQYRAIFEILWKI